MHTLFFVLFLLLNRSGNTVHHNLTYVNILSKSAIKVIEEDVDSESSITCISIISSNSQESSRQHDDIINDIAGAVTNGISIMSSNDRTFHIGRFKEGKRFNIILLDGLNGFR